MALIVSREPVGVWSHPHVPKKKKGFFSLPVLVHVHGCVQSVYILFELEPVKFAFGSCSNNTSMPGEASQNLHPLPSHLLSSHQ